MLFFPREIRLSASFNFLLGDSLFILLLKWIKHIMLIKCRGHRVVSFSSFSSPPAPYGIFYHSCGIFRCPLHKNVTRFTHIRRYRRGSVLKKTTISEYSPFVYIFIQTDMISYLSIWPFPLLLFYVPSSYIFTVYTYHIPFQTHLCKD